MQLHKAYTLENDFSAKVKKTSRTKANEKELQRECSPLLQFEIDMKLKFVQQRQSRMSLFHKILL